MNEFSWGFTGFHFHFYTDVKVIYCFATTLTEANDLQSAFIVVPHILPHLKFFLSANKTKLMAVAMKPRTGPGISILLEGKCH